MRMVNIPKHIRWRDSGSELVLFDEEGRRYGVLNDQGAEIWRGIARGLTTPQLVEELAARYDASTDTLTADVTAFLDRAVHAGMLLPDGQES
jgi:hypothetical protein